MGILAAVFANTLIQHMGDEAWNISSGAGCSLGASSWRSCLGL